MITAAGGAAACKELPAIGAGGGVLPLALSLFIWPRPVESMPESLFQLAATQA